MRFVHDQNIPLGIGGLPEAGGRVRQETDAANDLLIVQEGVLDGFLIVDRTTPFLVEQAHVQIEFAEHFDEPLMHERFRDDDQDPFDLFAHQQAVKDEARFDRFAQSDFVGKQNARRIAFAQFLRDVELMRDEIDSAPDEAQRRRLMMAKVTIQTGLTEFESEVVVPPAVEQPGFRMA